MMPAFFVLFFLALGVRASSSTVDCLKKSFEADVKISDLRPTQPNLGVGEVIKKSVSLAEIKEKGGYEDKGEPVPVVVGPDGHFYVSDNHHFVQALMMDKGPDTLVHVKVLENEYCRTCTPSNFNCTQRFWSHMVRDHLAYLCDNHDKPIRFSQLPLGFGIGASPKFLENDPYRTLVFVMRKTPPSFDPGNPCLDRPEDGGKSIFFWEFRMAEKIRRHIPKYIEAELFSAKNSKAWKLPQNVIDAACKAFLEDKSEESCAKKIADDPNLVLESVPTVTDSTQKKRAP